MRKRDDDYLEPDLTPLIDIVFILLIFFLVTSVFKKQELAMILNLPSSQNAESSKKNEKDFTIELKGEVLMLNGEKIGLNDLGQTIASKKTKESVVHIRSDKESKYYQVIEVLDALKKNQIYNINLITTKKP